MFRRTLAPVLTAACFMAAAPSTPGGVNALYDFPAWTVLGPVAGAYDYLDACYNPGDQEYLVVYRTATGISACRIGAISGVPIGDPILVDSTDGPSNYSFPSVAFAESAHRYLVTFGMQLMNGSGSVGRLLDASGKDVGGGRIDLSEGSGYDWNFGIASNGTDFLVAGPTCAWTFDSNMSPKAKVGVPDFNSWGYYESISVAWLGGSVNRYLVVWAEAAAKADGGTYLSQKIRSQTIGSDLVRGPIQTINSLALEFALRPRVAADPTHDEWGVVWEETDLYSWAGNVGYLGGGATFGPGGGVVEDWMQIQSGNAFFRRVSADGTPIGTPETLSGGSIGVSPRIAWSDLNGEYVILWQGGALDYDDMIDHPTHYLFETRIKGGSGEVVPEVEAVAVAYASGLDQLLTPVVAARSGSDEVLVAWLRMSADYYLHVEAEVMLADGPSPSPTPAVSAGPASGNGSGGGGGCSSGGAGYGWAGLAAILLAAAAMPAHLSRIRL